MIVTRNNANFLAYTPRTVQVNSRLQTEWEWVNHAAVTHNFYIFCDALSRRRKIEKIPCTVHVETVFHAFHVVLYTQLCWYWEESESDSIVSYDWRRLGRRRKQKALEKLSRKNVLNMCLKARTVARWFHEQTREEEVNSLLFYFVENLKILLETTRPNRR